MSMRLTELPDVPRPSLALAGFAEWCVRLLLSPLAATAYCGALAALVLISASPDAATRANMLVGAGIGAAFVIVLASLLVVMSVFRVALFAADQTFEDD